ncbi:DUF72 domain-containing protein [Thermoproteota archaeon]
MASLQEEIGYAAPHRLKPMNDVYLGTMGWSYSFWRLYEDLKNREYLKRYSEHFNSVEVNSTFYRIPRKSSAEDWRNQTPEEFKFSLKIPQSISHSQALQYDPEKLDAFLDHIKPLGKKQGPLLIQLPPKLSSEHIKQLDTLLTQLQGSKTAVEFRHKDWFQESTYDLLRDHNTALVYAEHPWQPSADVETSDFTYIRLEGDRKKVNGETGKHEQDRSTYNNRWATKIIEQSHDGRATYLYVSKYYSGYPPTDIQQIKTRLTSLKETQ